MIIDLCPVSFKNFRLTGKTQDEFQNRKSQTRSAILGVFSLKQAACHLITILSHCEHLFGFLFTK